MDPEKLQRVQDAIARSLRDLHAIRVMLWAGDYERARQAIGALSAEYGSEINESRALRQKTIREERLVKRKLGVREEEVEEEFTQEPKKKSKARLASEAKSKAALATANLVKDNEPIFNLGAISGVIAKLDRRVSEETGQRRVLPIKYDEESKPRKAKRPEPEDALTIQAIEDAETGFRYIEIPKDDRRWEWRIYRPDGASITLASLERALTSLDDLRLAERDTGHSTDNHEVWPFRFRGFTENTFVEIVLLDAHRLKVEMTAKRETDVQKYLKLILRAAASASSIS